MHQLSFGLRCTHDQNFPLLLHFITKYLIIAVLVNKKTLHFSRSTSYQPIKYYIIMKKTVLTLGSALMLLAATTLQAQDELSFGVQGGGVFLPASIGATKIDGKDYQGSWRICVGGGLFVDYRLLDDMMAVGCELGYAPKGFKLAEKKASTSNPDNNYDLTIHPIDIALKVSWLPMGREGGLSFFVGPKFSIPLSTKEKEVGKKDSKAADKDVIRSFNVAGWGGVKYEIAESGFFVGGTYEHSFLDTFTDEQKAKDKKKALGLKEDAAFRPNGIHGFVGFDFGRLLE